MVCRISENVYIAEYTTLKVGGNARYVAVVENEEDLKTAVSFAKQKKLPFFVLGSGSNTLVPDEGYPGIVILIENKGMKVREEENHTILTAQAGEPLDDVVAYAIKQGLWGIENLSHIPGTIGATPIQNVGAYGVEVKDVIDSVRVYDTQAETFIDLANEACAFSYRHSLFKTDLGKKYIVVSVTLRLSRTESAHLTYKDLQNYFPEKSPSLCEIRDAVITIRSRKFPNWNEIGTAGSFFKNPTVSNEAFLRLQVQYPEIVGHETVSGVKLSLGWILDKVLKLRGYAHGSVSTYEAQALVLVASHGATSSQITEFANEIVRKVQEATGITIEWEVTVMK
jgi:UDP-N-acetylmuramate dehydrogenase